MEQVFWDEEKSVIGERNSITTWYRVDPKFREFVKSVKKKYQIIGMIYDDDELNIGFIIKNHDGSEPE
jgi:hypothetical protein